MQDYEFAYQSNGTQTHQKGHSEEDQRSSQLQTGRNCTDELKTWQSHGNDMNLVNHANYGIEGVLTHISTGSVIANANEKRSRHNSDVEANTQRRIVAIGVALAMAIAMMTISTMTTITAILSMLTTSVVGHRHDKAIGVAR